MPRPIYSCFFIILLSAVLCSCRQAPVPAATDTPSPTPASSPTPSITPTPSPTSTPFLPPEVQAWTAAYPDFNWQEQLNSTGLNIPPEQLADRVKIGQGDVLQIYNEAGTAIDYSYDTENKVWIEAAKVLQPDKYNMESFIVVNSEEELLEEFRLEEMFLLPFSTNTYWPGPDKVNMDYIGDATPLGNLSGFSKAPTRLGVN